jgi:PAS domain S-box-containing protein
MGNKPTYKELEQQLKQSEQELAEQKWLENILKESEEKFKNLAENSPNMIFINQKGRIVYANKKCEETMGYKKEEFYSPEFDFLCLIAPESIDLIRRNFKRHMQGEEVAPFEYSLLTREGGELESIITTKLIDYKGETAILGIITDISKRKRAEKALQISEERYRSLIENINLGITLIDSDYNIIMANTAQGKLFNKACDAFVGKKCYREFEKRDNVCAYCPGRQAMSSGLPEEIETVGVLDDGSCFLAWIRAFPTFGSDNKVTGFIEIIEDITERKQTEEELKSAYQTTRNILNKAPFGIYVVNSQGHIDYVNPAMLELAGDTYQQFKNLNVINLSTYQKMGISEKIEGGLKGKYFKMEGVKYKSYYGNKTTIRNFIGIPLKEKGEKKLLMIIEDITETKRTEKALKKREGELESKTTSLEEVNTALRVMLKKKEEVKTEVEEKVLSNVKELVMPYLEKLKRSKLNVTQNTYLTILESNLNDITSSFSYKLSSNYLNLTPTEIRVANLIRHGNSTKEIAELMCLSKKTIDFHRNNIREKLGIKNQKANLRTHLTSLP